MMKLSFYILSLLIPILAVVLLMPHHVVALDRPSKFINPLEGKADTISDLLIRVVRWILGLVAFLAFLALVIGGIWIITALGNEQRVARGKQIVTWAIIGLAIVILAYAIINIVTTNILGIGAGNTPQ